MALTGKIQSLYGGLTSIMAIGTEYTELSIMKGKADFKPTIHYVLKQFA